jgi:hypothetical protein
MSMCQQNGCVEVIANWNYCCGTLELSLVNFSSYTDLTLTAFLNAPNKDEKKLG